MPVFTFNAQERKMGNATCALSNLPITYGDKVKLLFVTQNPYTNCDEHEAHKGCAPGHQWFLRTPPIAGKYADYGECDVESDPVIDVVTKLFKQDVVERPAGFCYNSTYVTRQGDFQHFYRAAEQGRLLVKSLDNTPDTEEPENFPTWQKVHELLKAAGLRVRPDSKDSMESKSYKAQSITPGVVAVSFGSDESGKNKAAMLSALAVFEERYSCKLVKDRSEHRLIVAPKGAHADHSLLLNKQAAHKTLTEFPVHKSAALESSVLPILVLEAVWQDYCELGFSEESLDVEYFVNRIGDVVAHKPITGMPQLDRELIRMEFDRLPFRTGVSDHIAVTVFDPTYSEESKSKIVRACAEALRVSYALQRLGQSWAITSLGSQESEWAARIALQQKAMDYCRAKLKLEEAVNYGP